MIKINELRTGNQLNYQTAEGDVLPTKIDWQDLKWLEEDPKGFNAVHAPITLTEDLMKKIWCNYNKDNNRIEFSMTPPGERQVENNYWSRELIDSRRLHLSPNYRTEFVDNKPLKPTHPNFWFIWICSHGTGSEWFLNIRDCHFNPLKYFHDLQNVYFSLSGNELFLKDENTGN